MLWREPGSSRGRGLPLPAVLELPDSWGPLCPLYSNPQASVNKTKLCSSVPVHTAEFRERTGAQGKPRALRQSCIPAAPSLGGTLEASAPAPAGEGATRSDPQLLSLTTAFKDVIPTF